MKIPACVYLISAFSALGVSASIFAASADIAKDYPDRPIRVIVPNAPGSSVDTLNRILVSKLGGILGQPLISDNRAGAGGVIGMEIAKAAVRVREMPLTPLP